MTGTFSLVDSLALGDLHVYLSRAAKVEEGSVRLIADSGVLAAYVAVFYPVGLRDETPTVLGLRTFALTGDESFDVVVPVRSLLDRIARLQSTVDQSSSPVVVSLPIEVNTVTWTQISPPRGGWRELDPVDASILETTAQSGIEEIAASSTDGIMERLLRRVRSEVWSRPIPGLEYLPAGAAFAAYTLGFLASEDVARVRETGPWTRLTTHRGHVLVRRKSWSLKA
ncbi:hypothetical protein [Parafrigoribacterium mesophilum]|uniref:hypothetical protein n=1 Tax=Parafrigoribacterium mesophilum TaxID=433646 RepID=UPI0031FC9319